MQTESLIPVSSMPEWEIDKWYEGLEDVLAAIREKDLNDIRRRDNLTYDFTPVYRPVVCIYPIYGESDDCLLSPLSVSIGAISPFFVLWSD